jgi:hypothetical protein
VQVALVQGDEQVRVDLLVDLPGDVRVDVPVLNQQRRGPLVRRPADVPVGFQKSARAPDRQ